MRLLGADGICRLQFICHNRLRPLHGLDVRRHASQPYILTSPARCLAAEQEVEREADVERIGFVNLLDVFVGQFERQRGDVAVEVRLLAASNDRKHVRTLVEDISQAALYHGQSREHSFAE